MKPADELVVAMAKLATGPAWDDYVVKFEAFRNEHYDLMMQAPPDKLQMFQGRAQVLSELLLFMRDCRQRTKKLRERENAG